MSVRLLRAQQMEKRTAVMLLLLLLLCYAYTFPRWADPNQNSRLDTVFAVVEDGTFRIDPYVANTVDYARFEGHYYSDKAPGMAFLGVPIYAALRHVLDLPMVDRLLSSLAGSQALGATLLPEGAGLGQQRIRFFVAQVVLAFVTSAIPTSLLGLLLYRLLARFTDHSGARMVVVLGYGLLTPVFAYAGAFYGHQLSATCLFAGFYSLFMGRKPLSAWRLLLVGFLLGYSVLSEYPAALIAGILFFYTLYLLENRWRIAWVVSGASFVAAGWVAYNLAVFRTPFQLGYEYSALWGQQHGTGFLSLSHPTWEALWGITFGVFRGLFVLSPWLLLALPGVVLWARSGEHCAELVVVVASVSSFFLFDTSSAMWWGGWAVGPRYLLPALPFLALPTIYYFREWGRQLGARWLAGALCAWSFLATWSLTLSGQSFPSDTVRNPLLEYAWPHLLRNDVARNVGMLLGLPGWLSLVPLLLFCALGVIAQRTFARCERDSPNESGSVITSRR